MVLNVHRNHKAFRDWTHTLHISMSMCVSSYVLYVDTYVYMY